MDDCQVFREMVLKKAFVSIIMGTEKDELYEQDEVLSLILIDTSTETDLFIHKELINQGIAVEVEPQH